MPVELSALREKARFLRARLDSLNALSSCLDAQVEESRARRRITRATAQIQPVINLGVEQGLADRDSLSRRVPI